MSAAIHGVEVGSSYHWMNDVMPACATSPTAERRAGGISAYQGSVSSSRLIVAVARSPEMRRSQASVSVLSICVGRAAIRAVSSRRPRCRSCRPSRRAGGTSRSPARRGERSTTPSSASACSVRTTIDGPSILKKRRAAGTRVREAEAVGAERREAAGHPRADLVLHRVHEVAHGDDRARRHPCSFSRDVRGVRLLVGVEEVVLVGGEAVAAQLGPRRDRPHVGAARPSRRAAAAAPRAPTARRRPTRGAGHAGPSPSAVEMRWMPRTMPSTSTSSGSAGCTSGSL